MGSFRRRARRGVRAACPPPPPLPSRTNWTRLVPPSRTNWTRLVRTGAPAAACVPPARPPIRCAHALLYLLSSPSHAALSFIFPAPCRRITRACVPLRAPPRPPRARDKSAGAAVRPRALVLCGPSGVGKGSIVERLRLCREGHKVSFYNFCAAAARCAPHAEPRPVAAAVPRPPGGAGAPVRTRCVQLVRERGTRRVQLVREGGGGLWGRAAALARRRGGLSVGSRPRTGGFQCVAHDAAAAPGRGRPARAPAEPPGLRSSSGKAKASLAGSHQRTSECAEACGN